MTIDVREEYRRLADLFQETAAMLEWEDEVLFRSDGQVSGWSPAQHLHHVWLSSSMSLHGVAAIRNGHDAVTLEGGPNEAGRAVLDGEAFQRGRARAPENVRPPDDPDRSGLEQTFGRSRAKLDQIEAVLDELQALRGRLPHPVLGVLNAREWMRFIRVHVEHHVAIVREITASKTRR